jgi:serine/threonine protein kinase
MSVAAPAHRSRAERLFGDRLEPIALIARSRAYEVWDAWSPERGCRCIAKLVRIERAEEEAPRHRLVREAELLLSLAHPHIVRAYELILDPEPVLVTETITGESLSHLLERHGGPLQPADVAMLGLQVGSALRHLHLHDVLHLDVKPGNVIAEAGRAKLIDLSLARPPGPGIAGAGTWSYMAPEQAEGGRLSAATDVWGLGAVLYEAASGRPAFDDPAGWTSDDGTETLSGYDGPYPQLDGRAERLAPSGSLPHELAAAIDACLEPAPTARPPIESVLAALERVALPEDERRWARAS